MGWRLRLALSTLFLASTACGSQNGNATPGSGGSGGSSSRDGAAPDAGPNPPPPQDGPPAGYPDGHAAIPPEAQAEDVSSPTTVVGTGTPASCTGAAFVAAVAAGGGIPLNCGPPPPTIVPTSPPKSYNNKGTKRVIDG